MAAVAFPQTRFPTAPSTRPAPHVVGRRDGARGGASPYRRRRLVLLTAALLFVVLVRLAVGALGGGSLTAPGPATRGEPRSVVVRTGDTLWTVAERLGPHGDVRATVDRLVAANHSAELHVGDRIALR